MHLHKALRGGAAASRVKVQHAGQKPEQHVVHLSLQGDGARHADVDLALRRVLTVRVQPAAHDEVHDHPSHLSDAISTFLDRAHLLHDKLMEKWTCFLCAIEN